MVIWLRRPRPDAATRDRDISLAEVGVATDVIRRTQHAQLCSMEQAWEHMRTEHDAILAQAHEEAAQCRIQAREEAAAIVERAQQEYAQAERRGCREGRQQALAQWAQRLAGFAHHEHQLMDRLRERLASLVTVSVETIVRTASREALFAQALDTLDRIVDGATLLRVRVCPDDAAAANEAFSRLALRWKGLGRPFSVRVESDATLGPGSCVCESDLGTVDASLELRLRALRAALARALREAEAGAQTMDDDDWGTGEDIRESDATGVENDRQVPYVMPGDGMDAGGDIQDHDPTHVLFDEDDGDDPDDELDEAWDTWVEEETQESEGVHVNDSSSERDDRMVDGENIRESIPTSSDNGMTGIGNRWTDEERRGNRMDGPRVQSVQHPHQGRDATTPGDPDAPGAPHPGEGR